VGFRFHQRTRSKYMLVVRRVVAAVHDENEKAVGEDTATG